MGLAYSFRVQSIIVMVGSMQADVVLEKELKVLYLDLQAAKET